MWYTHVPVFVPAAPWTLFSCTPPLKHCFLVHHRYHNTHSLMCKLARTIIYGLFTVFLAEKSPNIRPYTVYIYTVLANPMDVPCKNVRTRLHHPFVWLLPMGMAKCTGIVGCFCQDTIPFILIQRSLWTSMLPLMHIDC